MISEKDKLRLNEKITLIESQTDAELVTVMCDQSDDYHFIPSLWAALTAIVIPTFFIGWGWSLSLGQTVLMQLLCFLSLMLVFHFSPIKMWLIPSHIKEQRASRYAHQLFLLQGLHLTDNHAGVMLFVSKAERYVEVIADKALEGKVTPTQWQKVIDEFTEEVSRKRVAEGFYQAVESVGELLITTMPITEKKSNHLSNHLLEIKS